MADAGNAFLRDIEAPRGLFEAVLQRIARARRRAASFRLAAHGLGLFVFAAALVPSLDYTAHELYASGFWDYFSLFFSDSSLALAHWQELGLSLVESIPSLPLLFLTISFIAALWFLFHAVRSIKIIFAPKHITA